MKVAPRPTDPVPTSRGATRCALPLIGLAQLTVALDGTTAAIALPAIGADLGMSGAALTWILSGFALVFGGFLLLGGRLGDRYGYRRVLVAGLVLFAVPAAVRAVAPTEAVLLAARTLQGVGAALVSPAALALISATFPAGPARSRGYAVYAAVSGAGAGAGLLLGGLLTGLDVGWGVAGWRVTFLAVVPVALVVAALAPGVLPESPRRAGRLDVPGAVTVVLGLGGIVYGLTRAGAREAGWADPGTVVALIAGVAFLVVFVVTERRTAHPLLPLRIITDRVRAAGFLTLMCVMAANFAVLYFLTQLVTGVFGLSPAQAGLAVLPLPLGVVVGSFLAGRLAARFDPRRLALAGTVAAAVGLLVLSRWTLGDDPATVVAAVLAGPADAGLYWRSILPYLTVSSIGVGMTIPSVTALVMRTVPGEDAGAGAGLVNTTMQIGGAVGLSVLGTVATARADRQAGLVRDPISAGLAQRPELVEATLARATVPEGVTGAFLGASMLALAGAVVIGVLGHRSDAGPARAPSPGARSST